MEQDSKSNEELLLYDPMFDAAQQAFTNPQSVKRSSPVRKLIFITVLAICIGVSLFLSFNSLTKDKYQFENTEKGYIFSEFNGGQNDVCLNIEYVTDKDGVVQGNNPRMSITLRAKEYCIKKKTEH